jgi:acetyl esterase/lipase
MPLLADEQLTAFIASLYTQALPPASEIGVARLRATARDRATTRPKGPEMHEIREMSIPPRAIAARLYRPGPGPLPVVVYLHGGGWVIGDLETHDRACRRLAAASRAAVLAVDYRRAPEDPWPAAVEDAVATLVWIASVPVDLHPPPTAIAIAGDSAGGTTATLACLALRDRPAIMPSLQVLIYANTDLTGSGASMQSEGHGFGLEASDIAWFSSQWVPHREMLADPRVSPLRQQDLTGLPATIIITCEHDPLRDEGEAYGQRLINAGVPTTLRREEGMVHNFMLWDLISPACGAAADRVAADIGRAMRSLSDDDGDALSRTVHVTS